jgi:two-component system, NarL family, nitrate/nitrite response regulator NarL
VTPENPGTVPLFRSVPSPSHCERLSFRKPHLSFIRTGKACPVRLGETFYLLIRLLVSFGWRALSFGRPSSQRRPSGPISELAVFMSKGSAARKIRLLLLDDQILFRESLASLLGSEPDFEVAGQFASPDEVLEAVRNQPADVVIASSGAAHLLMPMMRNMGAAEKVLVVVDTVEIDDALSALRWGACGAVAQNTLPDSMIMAVRAIARGSVWFDQRVIVALAQASSGQGQHSALEFSEREQEVLRGISEGLTDRAIAARIDLTEGAVKSTVRQLLRRVGVKTRSQLVGSLLIQRDRPQTLNSLLLSAPPDRSPSRIRRGSG